MSEQTLDQRRATHAWNAVRTFAAGNIEEEQGKKVRTEAARKYGTQARKLPARIMAAGLGQALAFLVAKKECHELLASLSDWVLDKRRHPDSEQAPPAPDRLLREVISGDSDYLRFATAETLAYLQWLVRFAEAEGLTEDSRD